MSHLEGRHPFFKEQAERHQARSSLGPSLLLQGCRGGGKLPTRASLCGGLPRWPQRLFAAPSQLLAYWAYWGMCPARISASRKAFGGQPIRNRVELRLL